MYGGKRFDREKLTEQHDERAGILERFTSVKSENGQQDNRFFKILDSIEAQNYALHRRRCQIADASPNLAMRLKAAQLIPSFRSSASSSTNCSLTLERSSSFVNFFCVYSLNSNT